MIVPGAARAEMESLSLAAVRAQDARTYAIRLGQMIFWARDRRRMSQAEFGALLGVHRNTIGNWECGRVLPNAYQFHLLRKLVKERPIAA